MAGSAMRDTSGAGRPRERRASSPLLREAELVIGFVLAALAMWMMTLIRRAPRGQARRHR